MTETITMAATSQDALDALLCDLLPRQGCWSDEEYLWLTDHTNRLIEFTDGHIEELPMPTDTHQAILAFFYDLFCDYIRPRGVVRFASLRLRIREGKFREPDLLLLRDSSDQRDAIAARILTDLKDEQAWTERFEATTDEQWDRLAESARREIAGGATVPEADVAPRCR